MARKRAKTRDDNVVLLKLHCLTFSSLAFTEVDIFPKDRGLCLVYSLVDRKGRRKAAFGSV